MWVEVKLKEFVPYGTKSFEVKDGKLVEKGGSTTEAKAEADKENATKSALGEENAKSATKQAQQAQQTQQATQATQATQNVNSESARQAFAKARQLALEQMKQQAKRAGG